MQDLTTGSITRHLLKTMSFMLLSMLFQTLYVLIDLYWVGRLGTAAVAAVGISGNLMFIVLAMTQIARSTALNRGGRGGWAVECLRAFGLHKLTGLKP